MISRDIEIDIVKGIGICLVVLGHLSGYGMGLPGVTSFIYVFHMPLFFLVSGYFLRKDKPLLKTVSSKFRKLYLPFVIANFSYLLVMLFLGRDGYSLEDSVKILAGIKVMPKVGTTWFLIALFWASIIFLLINKIIGNKYLVLSISLLCYFTGTLIHLPFFLSQTLVAAFFLYLGYSAYSFGIKEKIVSLSIPHKFLSIGICMVVVYIISNVDHLDMYFNQYGNPFLLLIGAVSGTVLCVLIGSLLSYIKVMTAFFSFIGKNTLYILILHIIVIQGVFYLNGMLQSSGIVTFDLPKWALYIVCFFLAILVPAIFQSFSRLSRYKS